MFHDIEKYENYSFLDKAREAAKRELLEFMSDYSSIETIGMDMDELYNTKMQDWKALAIIDMCNPGHHSENFSETYKYGSMCKGLTNLALNFIKPHGQLVPHRDPLDTINGTEIKHYNCLTGIIIPSNDIKECGMKFEETEIFLSNDEWIVFEPAAMHQAWNHTDKYRVTLIATIDSKYWRE